MSDYRGVNRLIRKQLRERVAEWLKGELERRAMTSVALAEASGVSRATISEILNQRSDFKDGTLERLASALGTAVPNLGNVGTGASRFVREHSSPHNPTVLTAGADPPPNEEPSSEDMAARAMLRAIQLASAQGELHGGHSKEIMAEELERFADRLRDRLAFDHIAADLYKAALTLRRPG